MGAAALTGAFWFALIKSLPALLQFLSALADSARSARDRGIGYDQAVADGLQAQTSALRAATQAANEAAERHKADPTDNAFDQRFKRND